MASYNEMHEVLKKLHMEHLFEKFENEKITPDIIGSLSSYEMEILRSNLQKSDDGLED